MRLDALPVTFSLALLLCVDLALAAPSSPDPQQQRSPSASPRSSLHIPIVRRAPTQLNETELGLWAKQQKQFVEAKYSQHPGSRSSKRSTGYNMCVLRVLSFFDVERISLTVDNVDQACQSKY
jgi:hypothetical protein